MKIKINPRAEALVSWHKPQNIPVKILNMGLGFCRDKFNSKKDKKKNK